MENKISLQPADLNFFETHTAGSVKFNQKVEFSRLKSTFVNKIEFDQLKSNLRRKVGFKWRGFNRGSGPQSDFKINEVELNCLGNTQTKRRGWLLNMNKYKNDNNSNM